MMKKTEKNLETLIIIEEIFFLIFFNFFFDAIK